MDTASLHPVVGKHILAEFRDCDKHILDDEAYLIEHITNAAQAANATILDISSHHFEPLGVTTIALLAESHLSIHTWPEHGYAAVDVFTCGDTMDPAKGLEVLKIALKSDNVSIKTINRGMNNDK